MRHAKEVVIVVLLFLVIGGTISGCVSEKPVTFVGDPAALKGIYEAGYEMGWRTAAEQMKQEHALLRYQIILLQKKLGHYELQDYWDDTWGRDIWHLKREIARAKK